MENKNVPLATLRRYPIYLKALRNLQTQGVDKIMSRELSEQVSIKPTTIRRDFSLIGQLGKQGYGYDVKNLIEVFSAELGMGFAEKIILVGVGNLGKAILNYNQWDHVVGEIVCAFDKFPEKCQGLSIPVYDIKDLKEKIPEGCRIAILCISGEVQETVDKLVEVGIEGFADFTHQHFKRPAGINVRSVDVVTTVQELVFETNYNKNKGE
jgi:redox-sensing transcriptional repressor